MSHVINSKELFSTDDLCSDSNEKDLDRLMTSGNFLGDEDDSPAYLHTLNDNSLDIPLSKHVSTMLKRSVKTWKPSLLHSIVDFKKLLSSDKSLVNNNRTQPQKDNSDQNNFSASFVVVAFLLEDVARIMALITHRNKACYNRSEATISLKHYELKSSLSSN